MSKPFVFPDPNDRSANSPSLIVPSAKVLGIYNQNSGEKKERVTKKVQEWFCASAKKYQWDEAVFSGNQCILKVNIPLKKLPEEEEN